MNSIKYIKIIIKDELVALRDEFKESKIFFLAFFLAVAALIVYLDPFPSKKVNIATSAQASDWYIFAETTAALMKERGLNISVVTSEGAIDNVNKLNSNEEGVNAAFTYGGALDKGQLGSIYSLGSVSYEPVWIFYRKDKIGKITNIKDFAKFRVDLGPIQSGSYALAKKLFELYKLDVRDDRHFKSHSYSQMITNFTLGNSDAVVIVASYLDPMVQQLLREPGISLFSFDNAKAYEKRVSYLEAVSLPAGSIDLFNTIPKEDTELIATTASLVVRRDMHPDIQLALLMASKDAIRNSPYIFFAKRNEFPAYVDPLIPISPVAQHFYDYGPPHASRFLPYWLAGLVDRAWILLLTTLALFYPLSKLNLHLRKFRFMVKERPHYVELLAMDEQLCHEKLSDEKKKELLMRLDHINKKAIEAGVPVGDEADYFEFLNSIFLLRVKIEKN